MVEPLDPENLQSRASRCDHAGCLHQVAVAIGKVDQIAWGWYSSINRIPSRIAANFRAYPTVRSWPLLPRNDLLSIARQPKRKPVEQPYPWNLTHKVFNFVRSYARGSAERTMGCQPNSGDVARSVMIFGYHYFQLMVGNDRRSSISVSYGSILSGLRFGWNLGLNL